LLRTLVPVGNSVLGVFGVRRARERDRAGVRTHARTHDHVRTIDRQQQVAVPIISRHFSSHHITATSNKTLNNQQYTIHKQTRFTNEKMGRAKPKPKAKPKVASPVVIPPAATRKRAQVGDEHKTDKCKVLKGGLDEKHGPEPDVLKWALEEDKPD
jgi:hypothetical protein